MVCVRQEIVWEKIHTFILLKKGSLLVTTEHLLISTPSIVECVWLCQRLTWTTTLFDHCVCTLEVDLWLSFGGGFHPFQSGSHIFISINFVFHFQHVVHLANLCPSPQTWEFKSLETPLASSRASVLTWGQFYSSRTCDNSWRHIYRNGGGATGI